ncbi:MAG: lysylphosphatidylglycerol synthase transmembrane domain-containing protein [Thermomicrobiales bacterium]
MTSDRGRAGFVDRPPPESGSRGSVFFRHRDRRWERHGKTGNVFHVTDAAERRSPLLLVTSLILAALLLALALRGIHWHETFEAIRRSRLNLILLSALALTLSYVARGLRWQTLIRAQTPLATRMAFWTTMISYLANNILPARAGDVLRPIVTSRVVKTSVSFALAAVFLERIADILMVVAMSVGASLSLGPIPLWLRNVTRGFAVAGVAGVIGLFIVVRMERSLGNVVFRLPIPDVARSKISSIAQQFLIGFRTLNHPRTAFRFVALTALIWLLDVVTGMVIAWAMHLSVSWAEMTLLLVALSLASALPSTPGNIGVFPFIAMSVLVPFGLSRSIALAYILVFQVVTYVVESAWGGIGLWRITVALARAAETRVSPASGEPRNAADVWSDGAIADPT